MNQQIKEKLSLVKGKLPCAVAHYIATELGVSPLEVGQTANEVNVRGQQCQLGLFGYAQKGRPLARLCSLSKDPAPELAQAIHNQAIEGKISCLALWKIATQQDISLLEAGNAADALGLRVKPCQLGFF